MLEDGPIWHVGVSHPSQVAGGLNRFVLDLKTAQTEAVLDSHLFILGDDIFSSSLDNVHFCAPLNASVLSRLWGIFATLRRSASVKQPAIIHSHFALYALPALLWRRLFGRRVAFVVHFHGPWADESRATGAGRVEALFKKALERFVYRQADALIVLTQAFRDYLVDGYNVSPNVVCVVAPGVDLKRFSPSDSLLEVPARKTVLAVRRLVPRMGLSDLVRAMEHIDADCIISGVGQEHDNLVRLALELGIGDRVRLVGRTPESDLADLYRRSTVSVIPSRELEGFGLVAIESLACGVPVVASRQGGLLEAVGNFDGAVMFEPGDISGLTAALRSVLDKPPTTGDCVEYARGFGWPAAVTTINGIYTKTLRERKVGRRL